MKFNGISILLLTPMLLLAQTKDEILLTENSRALQFQVGRDFTLSSFQGAAISYKYHTQQYSALRFGITLSSGSVDSDGTNTEIRSDTVNNKTNNNVDRTNIGVQLNLQKLWYVEPVSTVLFFYGTGPFVGFDYTKTNTEQIWNLIIGDPQKSTDEMKAKSWSFGLTGLLGVEWFVSKTISFHAEYDIAISYSWTKIEGTSNYPSPGDRSTNERTNTSWQLSSRGVLFGVSIYFQ